jgi:hypothetical protein
MKLQSPLADTPEAVSFWLQLPDKNTESSSQIHLPENNSGELKISAE